MSRHAFRPLNSLIALLALLVAPHAFALEACIGSTAELETAVTSALLSGSSLQLKLRAGSFQLDNTLLTGNNALSFGDLSIEGGYNTDCSAQTLTPTLSKLYNFNNAQPAVFKLKGMAYAHNVELLGPIVFRGHSAGSHAITLDRVRVRESSIAQTLLIEAASNQVSLNVLVRNSVFHKFGAGTLVDHGLRVNALDANSALTVSNSTFASFDTSALRMRNLKIARFYNNVFWQSATAILEAADASVQSDVTLVNNTLTVNALLKAPIANSGTLLTNPSFVSINDLHLQNGSPAINAGTFFVIGGLSQIDFDGSTRVQGSAPDRGAYESIFSDLGTITVTNKNDSGAGSLRQAIISSKTQTIPITIGFNIPGGCPQVIELVTPLESIGKAQQTIIDGYTQPGASRSAASLGFNGSFCVFVSGKVNNVGYAMNNNAATHQFTIAGLSFGGFTDTAIKLNGVGAVTIEGNNFGLGLSNEPAGWVKNARGIRLEGGASNKTIGGPNPGQRNLLNSSTGNAVTISSGSNNQVINNYIGLDANGTTARGNGTGIRIDSSGNLVQGNYIAGNLSDGIFLIGGGNNNTIKDNVIGRKHTFCIGCSLALGNVQNGIYLINGASGNVIENNTIAHSGLDGIRIAPTAADGLGSQRNRIVGNRVFANAGMGIELQGVALADGTQGPNGTFGPNPINVDPLELANETNAGQNYPTITTITELEDGSGILDGSLSSRNGEYLIEAFASLGCDGNGFGEGETLVGSVSGVQIIDATASANGTKRFSIELLPAGAFQHAPEAQGSLVDQRITLIATDALGSSSEFSQCVPFRDVVFAAGFE